MKVSASRVFKRGDVIEFVETRSLQDATRSVELHPSSVVGGASVYWEKILEDLKTRIINFLSVAFQANLGISAMEIISEALLKSVTPSAAAAAEEGQSPEDVESLHSLLQICYNTCEVGKARMNNMDIENCIHWSCPIRGRRLVCEQVCPDKWNMQRFG